MVNIFIANLDWSITSDDLKNTFSSFGPVHYAHVVYEKDTKRSKGFGYVEMESAEHAINAIEALNGMEINGRAIDVKIASPKGNRPEKKKVEKPQFGDKKNFKPRFEKREGYSQNRGYGENRSQSQGEDSPQRKLRPRRNKNTDN